MPAHGLFMLFRILSWSGIWSPVQKAVEWVYFAIAQTRCTAATLQTMRELASAEQPIQCELY